MTIIKMTEKEIFKKHPLNKALRIKIKSVKDADLNLSEMPKSKFLKKMARPGRPTIANPKQVMSFRFDSDVASAMKKLGKNYSSKVNDVMRGWLSRAGLL